MPFSLLSIVILTSAIATAYAAPAPNAQKRAVSQISSADLSNLAPFTQFARAAYCPPILLQTWSCGQACTANSDFQPTLVGGDGNAVQIFFVGFSPSQNSIIVAHEAVTFYHSLSDLTDANIVMEPLSSALFPGVNSSVRVHGGFRDEHATTATTILTEVKRLMKIKNTNTITTIGHSLGGALAELEALFLTLNLPSTASVKAVTYGTPRVGNPDFAALVDSKVANFRRIDNERDIVPIVPGRFLDFQHPHGEIHIISPGNAVSCPGDDDATDSQCQIQSVPNIAEGNLLNHLGPYEGIFIGTIFCT